MAAKYRWRISWSDVTAPAGPATPVWNGTAWEYVSSYTVPTTATLVANAGDKYKLVVATTSANLGNVNCRFTDNGNIITLSIVDCGIPLATRLVSFTGHIGKQPSLLNWSTSGEDEIIYFDVEKSYDGIKLQNDRHAE